MRDRLIGDEIADVMGFDRDEVRERILASPIMSAFRQQLFARVVPNVKRLGLLTPRVRERVRADRRAPVRGRRPRGAGPRARALA